jgi:Fe-S-cluster containining protein
MSGKRERRKREYGRRRPMFATGRGNAEPAVPRESLAVTAEAVRRAVASILQDEDTPPTRPQVAEGLLPGRVAAATLGLALRVIQQSPLAGQHACRAGCDFCCHTAVTVAPPEVFAIADYLRAHYGAEELRAVHAQLDRNAARAASVTRDAYIAALIPCALLTPDGNCRAYHVRPLACAGFLSTSREACAAEFQRVPGRGAVPLDRHGMAAGLGAAHGLKLACQAAGRDGEFHELHHALRRALDEPDASERWAREARVFEGCMP